jgi:hypothetical protein
VPCINGICEADAAKDSNNSPSDYNDALILKDEHFRSTSTVFFNETYESPILRPENDQSNQMEQQKATIGYSESDSMMGTTPNNDSTSPLPLPSNFENTSAALFSNSIATDSTLKLKELHKLKREIAHTGFRAIKAGLKIETRSSISSPTHLAKGMNQTFSRSFY